MKRELIAIVAATIADVITIIGCSKEGKDRLVGSNVATSSNSSTSSGVAKAFASLNSQSALGGSAMSGAGSSGGSAPALRSPGFGVSVTGCSSPFSGATDTGEASSFTGTNFYKVPDFTGEPPGGGDFTPKMAGSATNGTKTIDMLNVSQFCDNTNGFPSLISTSSPSVTTNITMKMAFKGGGKTANGDEVALSWQMSVAMSFTSPASQGGQPTVSMTVNEMSYSGTTTSPNGKTITYTFSANVPFSHNFSSQGKDFDPPGTVTTTIQPDNLVITGTLNSSGVFSGTATQDGVQIGTVTIDDSGNGTFTANDGTTQTFTVGFAA